MTISDAVRLYLEAQASIEKINNEAEAKVKQLEAVQDRVGAFIKFEADSQGVKSFKTEFGTAYFAPTDFANVADWSVTLAFIQESGRWELLTKNVSKKEVKQYLEEVQQVPPGVNYGKIQKLHVRKSA